MKLFILPAIALIAAAGAQPRDAGRPSACIDIAAAQVTIEGRLEVREYSASPDATAPDDPRVSAFILALDAPQCFDDRGEFVDGAVVFTTVHVTSNDATILARLPRAAGRRASVTGEAFGAHTVHHRAPLVVIASALRVR